jgi:AcrR family transcriptional regulator
MNRPKPPPVRRAPSSVKSERRIKEILLVARQVFSEVGFSSATTIEMARRLGVSEATIFTYFTGKRDLCVRVICDWYDEIIGDIEGMLPQIPGTQAQLAYLIRTHLHRLMVDGTGLCALILSEGRAKDDTFGDDIVRLQRRYTAPLMTVLADGIAAGDIRSDLPLGLLRSSVYGPMEHVLWDAISGKKIDVDATAKQLSTFIWQALQPPDPDVAALGQLQRDVAAALRHFEHHSAPAGSAAAATTRPSRR